MKTPTWKDIKILPKDAIVEDWWETSDGTRLKMPIYYSNLVDLENMRYCYCDWNDKIQGYQRLQDLVMSNTLTLKHIYGNECRLVLGNIRSLSIECIRKIQNYFLKECGIKPTHQAIKHQYESWLCDYKSGYRDDKNGYFLFSPCGCNPFSISLTKLPKEMKIDWQTTYQY